MTVNDQAVLRVPSHSRSRSYKNTLSTLGLSSPAVIWYAVFTIGPLFAMFYLSTLEWRSFVSPSSFVGLENYQKLVVDPVFWTAAKNSAIQISIALTIVIPASFLVAYYINLQPRGHRVLRVILFTPALISLAAKSLAFLSIFSPTGLVNGFLTNIGLGELASPWLASPDTALGVIIILDIWNGIGFTAILFSARMSSISSEVFEAAQLDGAGHWRTVTRIAYPMCRDYVGVILMLQYIWLLFGSAGSILLLTKGGPGNASTTLSFLVYDKAFTQSQIGYSQAVGVILFALGILGTFIILRIFRSRY